MSATPRLISSGDLLADRRYAFAQDLAARSDHAAAADLLEQALERAPTFAAAWFALGEARESLGAQDDAIDAYKQALARDPGDRYGVRLRLARLGVGSIEAAMSPAYVTQLFDIYAPRFDDALAKLEYRAPALLHAAVQTACAEMGRIMRFSDALDLGCGTGLCGAAFRGCTDRLTGVDLSPGMIAAARAKGVYDRLIAADMVQALAAEAAAGARYSLITAADVFVYLADLDPVLAALSGVVSPDGLLAFTVESHLGEGVILGEKLRYAHGDDHVRTALAQAGLAPRVVTLASTRTENRVPVPGLVVVASAA